MVTEITLDMAVNMGLLLRVPTFQLDPSNVGLIVSN